MTNFFTKLLEERDLCGCSRNCDAVETEGDHLANSNFSRKLALLDGLCCGGGGDAGGDQSNGDDLYHQGLNCLQNGDHQAAINFFEKCIQLNRNHTQALYHLGQIHQEKRKFNTAYSYYRRVLVIDEDHQHANFSLGTLCSDEEQYGKAEGYLQKA
eukprot:CAMPEP_0206414222 /NCGR_PEP_ID=MMETSP0294-20121207/35202_1 /ASSEMBLY_ACC=CAM_ASM_000327 /TAXON_ID=39354 /ORGANISM="Heterosigma akashiwo, Strain CCMP2393" /LENGTH=155 /DNA_ID=CAMNT_0053876003 /DNA_START=131 /DNA_END=594 /DNA_ORIENTATION=+